MRSELLDAAPMTEEERAVVVAARSMGLSAEDQLEARRILTAVRAGSAWNGYTMARLQGMTREEAIARPATAALLAAVDVLGPEAPAKLQRIFKL